jgi:Mrp family chromosome partitioning ATPase
MTRPDSSAPESDLTNLRATLAELVRSREVLDDVSARLSTPRSVSELRNEVTGNYVTGTVLVDIAVEDPSPAAAAEIANTIAEVLPLHDPSDGSFQFTTSDTARPALRPSSPNLPLVVGVAALLGLLLAGLAAVARDRVKRKVTNKVSLEAALNAPVLGTLSPPRDKMSLPALYEGTEAASAFRELRIALEAAATANPVQKIVVTGVRPSDVNVWLGANLAIALAQVGSRVLLVDGRLGDVHGRPIAAAPDTPGLYDVLQGVALERALSPGPVDRLSVLPSGDSGGAPIEAIVESRFSTMTEEAVSQFDVVVVLAPALSLGSDAVVMAVNGSMLLAVPSGSASAAELRAHAMHMRSVGGQLLGSVLIGRRRGRR